MIHERIKKSGIEATIRHDQPSHVRP